MQISPRLHSLTPARTTGSAQSTVVTLLRNSKWKYWFNSVIIFEQDTDSEEEEEQIIPTASSTSGCIKIEMFYVSLSTTSDT